MNILHARELQRRLDAEAIAITVLSLHPGTGVITGQCSLTSPFRLASEILC